ncbi:MAG: SusC/RagA family TonB-linked outer membrane protein [Ferruginibacter sp.]|uniref:SusC/RagA family TonB-linked outer membrane protein n=1 Tax=Ferruginibacter sp. TaxID=1940288 RepID=UPI0026597D85|nr:SusC/RagA family TonB-linked outer membrane protein [Ferruginibacter sp.]MDB5279417.1 SusC/RagA family TonB-linked outer membrane protein [Ferruginibacter sp.]
MRKSSKLIGLVFFVLICQLAKAQNKTVTGKLTDSSGRGLPGATIQEKKTKHFASTDKEGRFEIAINSSGVLLVSAVGYEPAEFSTAGKSEVNIILKQNTVGLNEVVVTALGVKRDKRNLTYSTQELKGDVLTNSKEPNLVNAMAGKVSGVQITSSAGTAGASSRIVIRGATSATGDNQALFVIDGVPINNDETATGGAAGAGTNRVSDIDPASIENITVLKGAAATALYGSSGAKGVVMITTKSGGIDKKPAINISSELSFEKALLPERQTKYGQGINGVFSNGEDQKTSASWGPLMDTLKINGSAAPKYDPWKSFLRKGITSNNSVSISGGGIASSYFLSYSYFDQQGVVPVNNYKRNSLFAKYNTKIYKNLSSTFQLGYTNSNQTRLPEGWVNGPLFVLMGQPISWNPYPVLNADGSQRLYRFSRNPPLWTIDNMKNNATVNRFIPVLTFNYTPLSWLTVTERLGADIYTEQNNYYNAPSPALGPADSEDPNASGSVRNANTNFRQFNNDLIINAHKAFNKFDVNLLVGNNVYSNYSQYVTVSGTKLTIADFYNVSSAKDIKGSELYYEQRKLGFYTQANIEYNKLLALSLTGRYDGSSVLAKDKQFYPYGSAALSFIFSELFPKSGNSFMNFGKLRFSYATVGNDGVGAYQLGTPYILASRASGNFPFQGQPGFLLSPTLGNSTLKNERLNEYEVGVETKFLNNRIGLEASYFYRKSTNGIIPGVAISAATGYTGTTVNSASIENKGVEVLLNVSPVKTNNFNWDMTVNFSTIRNKVLQLYPGLNQLGRLIVGEPYNIFYGDKYARNASGKMLVDADGHPFADGQGIVGNANPDWLGGMSNSFRYKQFSLDVFFDVKKGGDVWNGVDSYGTFYGTAKATENRKDFVLDAVSAVDGKANTIVIKAQDFYRNNQLYEAFIQDGSYIKLRTVSLTYRLDPALLKRTIIKTLSLSVTGRNLWIYSPHFTGADPEVSSWGTGNGDVGVYAFSSPTSRSVNFALKLGF